MKNSCFSSWSSILDKSCLLSPAAYPRTAAPFTGPEYRNHRRCLALLRMRFALPPPLPKARWALTPPFHPYPKEILQAVYFLLHCLSAESCVGTPASAARPLTGILSEGARTFLQEAVLSASRRPAPPSAHIFLVNRRFTNYSSS